MVASAEAKERAPKVQKGQHPCACGGAVGIISKRDKTYLFLKIT